MWYSRFSLLALWLLLIISACTSAKTTLRVLNPVADETPVYRLRPREIAVDLNRAVPPDQQPVMIYQGYAPTAINWSQPVATDCWGSVRLPVSEQDRQHFFGLVTHLGDTVRVAERLIPLRGTDNFRDLGGYATEDGRTVRWGLLYRSGDLANLKAKDRKLLSHLPIETVVDFRNAEDRLRKPDRLPKERVIRTVNPPVYDVAMSRRQYRRLLQKMKKEDDPEQLLIALNRMYVTQFTDTFALAIKALMVTQPVEPTGDTMSSKFIPAGLYHCSAGKDRTGFMSAMLLSILGVPRQTIMRDYMASNYYRYSRIRRHARLAPLIGIRSEVARALLEVRLVYLEEVFRTIEDEYGSVERYIRQGLGISKEEQSCLRALYLSK